MNPNAPIDDACIDPALLAISAPPKVYRCHLCPYFSPKIHNLKVHVDTHDYHASHKFSCDECGRRFTRKNDVQRHYQTYHTAPIASTSKPTSGSTQVEVDFQSSEGVMKPVLPLKAAKPRRYMFCQYIDPESAHDGGACDCLAK
jgi:hypothetical protein